MNSEDYYTDAEILAVRNFIQWNSQKNREKFERQMLKDPIKSTKICYGFLWDILYQKDKYEIMNCVKILLESEPETPHYKIAKVLLFGSNSPPVIKTELLNAIAKYIYQMKK